MTAMRASSLELSCPAKAGQPVASTLAVETQRLGLLDHPLSRMMTESEATP
jgi:hypothetical protein